MNKRILEVLLAGALAGAGFSAKAQVIDFTGGGADLTFFYDNDTEAWDIVFRAAEGSIATGLDTQADQDRFGASADDYEFTTLNLRLGQPSQITAGENQYFASAIGGEAENPDLGIRTRLREDAETDQFDAFRLALDWEGSIHPEGAEFALFDFDAVANPRFRYETAADDFTHDWDAWGHSHWHWGFTEPGDYTLEFQLTGLEEGLPASEVGTTSIHFEVIPEPAAIGFLLGAGAFGFVVLRRRRAAKD